MSCLKKIICMFVLCLAPWVYADVYEYSEARKVYYEYTAAESGQPTVVLLNGLIYDLDQWSDFIEELNQKGIGTLLIAYSSQPESLSFLTEPAYFSEMVLTPYGYKQKGLEMKDLVQEIEDVVSEVGLREYFVLSLSYGSIIGAQFAEQNKEEILSYIMVSPSVKATHRYYPIGEFKHDAYVGLGGYGDYWYDIDLYAVMKPLVFSNFSTFGIDDVDFETFYSGVFQMVRAAKYFNLLDYAEADFPPLHLVVTSEEDPALYKDQNNFWNLLDGNEARMTKLTFIGGAHALTGVAPKETAEHVVNIIQGKIKKGEYTKKLSGSGNGGSSTSSLLYQSRK